jgi:hypothetical protein
MIEDMTIRKFAPKTQHDYVHRVKHFAAFLRRSPDTASFEDVRRYQLHLAASGAGVPTINQSVSTLRFFFNITLGRADIVNHTQFIHVPRKLPVILSPEEVARFLDAAPGLKYKVALSVAYGAGLRVSEVVALKVSDNIFRGFLLWRFAYAGPRCAPRHLHEAGIRKPSHERKCGTYSITWSASNWSELGTGEAEGGGGLEINDQLVFERELNGQIARICASQNLVNIRHGRSRLLQLIDTI